MNHRTLSACLAAALLLAAPIAQAGARAANLPDPLDARAAVPPVSHESAFAGYRSAGEADVGSWREANEAVNRIGGWRAYAREASRPAPAAPGGAGAPVQPVPGGSIQPPPGTPVQAAPAEPAHSMPGHGAHRGALQ
jgi:hypothetical protein